MKKININSSNHSIARRPRTYLVLPTPSSSNAQAPNPPVSDSPAALPSSSHRYQSAAFQQQMASEQALLLNNTKLSARKDPIGFCRQFYAETSKLTEKSRTELAKFLADASPRVLADNIQKFKLSDESRVVLGKIVAEKSAYAFAENIQNFSIFDDRAKIELAHIIAKKDPIALISHIHKFWILDENAKSKLLHMVAEKELPYLASHVQNFAISNENDRIALAYMVAEKYPTILIENIQNFSISNENAKIGLAKVLIRKHLSTSLISDDINYLEKLQISNPSIRSNLYASVYLGLIAKGDMSAADRTWINNFFSRDPQPMPLAQVAAQFGNPHPVITDLLTSAKQQDDPYIRETLSTWSQLVSLRFATDHLPEAAWQDLKSPLKAIQKWRMPAMRYVLTHLLAQQCLPPEAKDVNGFLAFCKQFTKPHTHLYPALLFPIFQSAPNAPTLQKLVTLLHRQEFKDVIRQKAMVNALAILAQADFLPDNLKRSLLQAALPNGSGKEAVRALAATAPLMECMVLLSSKLGYAVLQRLQTIQKPGDFNEKVNEVFRGFFPNLPNTQNAAACFSRYIKHARHPTGVLSYAAKMQNGLDGQGKASVLTAIGRFFTATVLSPNPEQSFRQLRYDSAASSHLGVLANGAQEVFKQWQQPCIYEPSAAFLAQTSGSTKQTSIFAYLHERIVMDKHVSPGTYPLLEQVLTREKMLASALQEANATTVEADLLRLLDEQTPRDKKAGLITQLLEALPQDHHQFGLLRQDLTDLKTLLTPSPLQDAKHFTVIDTDAAEDLFLCGTEVVGSCQNIQGAPNFNKALMGYALDGKYRMLAIKSADERLMGRRMLRLLWDEQAQQPVLHLERLYHNPGIPKKYEQALVELALQKAEQMNCALVSHDQTLQSDGNYPATLFAYPTPWPFEYVDAQGLGVQTGRGGYQLSEARIVASLPGRK